MKLCLHMPTLDSAQKESRFFLRDLLTFFNIQVLSTFVTCHGMVFLCICIVYVRYTF